MEHPGITLIILLNMLVRSEISPKLAPSNKMQVACLAP
jgi:hypothetical protein